MATLDAVLRMMLARGWRPGGPASEESVARLEAEFDVTLPADYRRYLLAAGGGESAAPEAYTGLWPVRIVAGLNRHYRIPWNFPGLFGIGNDGFLVYALDFRNDPPGVVSLGLSSSVWEDVVTETDSFTEWLERRLPR
ncbi:MAG: SMI1/KNR4 family protein [Planctomycetota bacterium]